MLGRRTRFSYLAYVHGFSDPEQTSRRTFFGKLRHLVRNAFTCKLEQGTCNYVLERAARKGQEQLERKQGAVRAA